MVMKSIREASVMAVQAVRAVAVDIFEEHDGEGSSVVKKEMLKKCAMTSLNSKLVSGEKAFFADMVVDAVNVLDPRHLDLGMLGIKKVQGGGLCVTRFSCTGWRSRRRSVTPGSRCSPSATRGG